MRCVVALCLSQGKIANQLTRWRSPLIAIGIEQKVANLELKLAEALDRITQLEQRRPATLAEPYPVEERVLLPLDSPEMSYALQLAAECFPGSQTEVEVEFDPAEPHWKWYSFNVRWSGEVRDSISRQSTWHSRLDESFPSVGEQFRICVLLQ